MKTNGIFSKITVGLLICLAGVWSVSCETPDGYRGSTFSAVWGKVKSDPYATLPHYDVTPASFFDAGVNLLYQASMRTLDDRSDLLPPFDKLLHPNGVCLSGTWRITEQSPYTGYFEQGKEGRIIVRASVGLSETERGHYRSFGFTGKLFPTTDPDHTNLLKTANFFTIDNASGTLAEHYLDVAMTNQPAAISAGSTQSLGVAAIAALSLGLADTNAGIRQLYEISELGLSVPANAVTPQWMKISATPGQIRVDEADFRNELDLSNYPDGTLSFDIHVTTPESLPQNKIWMKIGKIVLDDYAATESCDHCLHFHHPKFKEITTQKTSASLE